MIQNRHDFPVRMAELFKALADPTRLRLIRMLASNMETNLCVADLAGKLGISQPAASQHLRVLKSIGILIQNRQGFRVYYSIDASALAVHKADMDVLFKMAFEKCAHYGTCKGHATQ